MTYRKYSCELFNSAKSNNMGLFWVDLRLQFLQFKSCLQAVSRNNFFDLQIAVL